MDDITKLRELKALVDEGVLTEEEFAQEKAKILAGMTSGLSKPETSPKKGSSVEETVAEEADEEAEAEAEEESEAEDDDASAAVPPPIPSNENNTASRNASKKKDTTGYVYFEDQKSRVSKRQIKLSLPLQTHAVVKEVANISSVLAGTNKGTAGRAIGRFFFAIVGLNLFSASFSSCDGFFGSLFALAFACGCLYIGLFLKPIHWIRLTDYEGEQSDACYTLDEDYVARLESAINAALEEYANPRDTAEIRKAWETKPAVKIKTSEDTSTGEGDNSIRDFLVSQRKATLVKVGLAAAGVFLTYQIVSYFQSGEPIPKDFHGDWWNVQESKKKDCAKKPDGNLKVQVGTSRISLRKSCHSPYSLNLRNVEIAKIGDGFTVTKATLDRHSCTGSTVERNRGELRLMLLCQENMHAIPREIQSVTLSSREPPGRQKAKDLVAEEERIAAEKEKEEAKRRELESQEAASSSDDSYGLDDFVDEVREAVGEETMDELNEAWDGLTDAILEL